MSESPSAPNTSRVCAPSRGAPAGGVGCLARDARERRLLANRADHRIVDRDEIAPVREVRVGEDVGRGVGGRDRYVVRDAARFDLGRVERGGPLGDDAVDLVVVLPRASASFANRGSSTRSGRSIASHRRAKFVSEPATMHTYLPSRVG